MITIERKRELTAAHVTLNGKPARITGIKEKFARVAPIDLTQGGVEYSWPVVDRIVREKNGIFEAK